MTNNPENAESCGAQSSSLDRQVSQAPTSAQPALINWLLQLASQPKPVVVGFYREADETWGRSNVEELLQEAARKNAGKCLFVAATFPEEDFLQQYENGIEEPSFAVFLHGSLITWRNGSTISPVEMSELVNEGLEFANHLQASKEAVAWFWNIEGQWTPRIRLNTLDHGSALELLAGETMGGEKAFATSSLPVFQHQIAATANDSSLAESIAIIYAPPQCGFWDNIVRTPLNTAAGVLLDLRVPDGWAEVKLLAAREFQPTLSSASWLCSFDTTPQPKFIPPWVDFDLFWETHASGIIFLCSDWQQWCDFANVSQHVTDIDYVYCIDDPKAAFETISSKLSSPGRIRPANLPAMLAVRSQAIVDCVAAEYKTKDEGAVFPGLVYRDHFRCWRDGTLAGLEFTAEAFLEDARCEITTKYARLVREWKDKLRAAGVLDEYMRRHDALCKDELHVVGSADDPFRDQAEKEFLAECEWPLDRDLNSCFINAIAAWRQGPSSCVVGYEIHTSKSHDEPNTADDVLEDRELRKLKANAEARKCGIPKILIEAANLDDRLESLTFSAELDKREGYIYGKCDDVEEDDLPAEDDYSENSRA